MFRKRFSQDVSKYWNTLLRCLDESNYTNKWLMQVHKISQNVQNMAYQLRTIKQLVTDEDLIFYVKTKSKYIAIQPWYSVLSNSKLTECYALYKMSLDWNRTSSFAALHLKDVSHVSMCIMCTANSEG